MLENAAAIGVPIPKRLVEALEALKEKGGMTHDLIWPKPVTTEKAI